MEAALGAGADQTVTPVKVLIKFHDQLKDFKNPSIHYEVHQMVPLVSKDAGIARGENA